MYEKPELTLVGNASDVVLGSYGEPRDNEAVPGQVGEGLALGLD